MERVEQTKPVDKKEVTLADEIKNDDTIKGLNELVRKTNIEISNAIERLAAGDVSKEEIPTLVRTIFDAREEVALGLIMHHHYIMALYAKRMNDETNNSPAKRTYW